MAAKKENNAIGAAEPAEMAPSTVPKPSLPSFSRLVSAAGTVMRFRAGELGSPSEAQRAAFATLCEPRVVAGLALFEALTPHEKLAEQEGRNRGYQYYRHDADNPDPFFAFGDKGGVFAGLFAALGKDGWETLATAIDELAGDVERAASSGPFQASAREGARLAVHPASDAQLNYPSVGMALGNSGTMVGGKKSRSLGGFMLPRAGAVDTDPGNDAGPRDLTAEQKGARVDRQWEMVRAGLLPEEDAEWLAAKEQMTVFAGAGEGRSATEGHFERFVAGGVEVGAVVLNGEAPLPNARLLVRKAAEALASPLFTSLVSSASPQGADVLSQVDHLGVVKNDRADALAARFQATAVAPWGKALAASLAGAPLSSRPLHEFSLRGPAFASLAGSPWAAAGGVDSRSQRTIAAREAIKKACALHKEAMASRGRADYDLRDGWAQVAARTVSMPEIGEKAWPLAIDMLGFDMAKLSKGFSARPARVGLLQLATMMISAGRYHDNIVKISQDANNHYNRGNAPPAVPAENADHLALAPALGRLEKALAAARSSYASGVFAEAARVEDQWMEQAGFGPAWRQALAMGEPSTRSIAWSALNPMSDAISSADPMQRLAGSSARGLGLSSKLDPARVAQDYKEALAARGVSPVGIELLERSEGAREVFERLGQGMALPQKSDAYACSQALEFACHALSSCAAQGFSPEQVGMFMASYADAMRGQSALDSVLETGMRGNHYWSQETHGLQRLFMAGHSRSKDSRFDGLGPALGQVPLRTLDAAETLRDLGQAKRAAYPALVDALAADWAQTLAESNRLGLGEAQSGELARVRAAEIRSAIPTGPRIDWTAGLEGQPAWRLFGIPSPRLSAALLDAKARGGDLGAWAAERARKFGVDDARDGNDVVAQVRDKAKAQAGMADAAWRLAIKDRGGLALLDVAMEAAEVEVAPKYRGPRLDSDAADAFADQSMPLKGARSDDLAQPGKGPLFGVALTAAAAAGIPAQDAADVGKILMGGSREANLFGMEIQPQVCQGGQGADSYCQETMAKRSRLPRIFIEACRRYQKFKTDAAKPRSPGPDGELPDLIDPKRALADEVTDLVDWVSGSEQGLWVQIPKDPTWGQMRRLSKSWHDEQALIAMEKASRQKLSQELAQAKFDEVAGSNPFMVKNSTRWAKLLGTHASEGWEAVELQSSADLTEEGAAMHHCVSSYSGTCREGSSRIFSVRLNGERVSTLEIQGTKTLSQIDPNMSFLIHQNKGSYNQAPSKQCRDFCEEVLVKIQGSWPRQVAAIERKLEERKAELARLAKERKAELEKSLGLARTQAGAPK